MSKRLLKFLNMLGWHLVPVKYNLHNEPYTHIKLKELFREPREPFYCLVPFTFTCLIPKRSHFGSPEIQTHVSGSPGGGDQRWLPRRPPLNTGVWLPPESHFGSPSFICVGLTLLSFYEPAQVNLHIQGTCKPQILCHEYHQWR